MRYCVVCCVRYVYLCMTVYQLLRCYVINAAATAVVINTHIHTHNTQTHTPRFSIRCVPFQSASALFGQCCRCCNCSTFISCVYLYGNATVSVYQFFISFRIVNNERTEPRKKYRNLIHRATFNSIFFFLNNFYDVEAEKKQRKSQACQSSSKTFAIKSKIEPMRHEQIDRKLTATTTSKCKVVDGSNSSSSTNYRHRVKHSLDSNLKSISTSIVQYIVFPSIKNKPKRIFAKESIKWE